MENQNIKCSSSKHEDINAIAYCPECKKYLCNKCLKFHTERFEEHKTINVNQKDEIFIDKCKEPNHKDQLEFYCKDNDTSCSLACISKSEIKVEGYGQHVDCNVTHIKDIKDEKRNKLKENINNLEELYNNIDQSIIKLKEIFEQINKSKEDLKLKVQSIFTKLRNALNTKEDKLLLDIDEYYNYTYFKEDIIKQSEKLPNKIKKSIKKSKILKNEDYNSCINLNKMIKSNLILKKIFSCLDLNLKLDIIKYNKKIQNKFQIDTKYYKKISGKYFQGKRNGKGNEYTLDKKHLIFEGEYLNGKRNGNGKEYYDNGYIKFEGEYLKGIKLRGKRYNENGNLISKIDTEKGEEYYHNGKIRFKGEHVNGKIWKGYMYDIDENKEFEVKYGKMNGKGKEYNYEDKLIFVGEYFNNNRWNGKGWDYFNNGSLKLEGEYLNGKEKRIEYNNKHGIIFEGEYLNGKKHGKCKEYYDNGYIKFEGEYLNGEKHGKGKEYNTHSHQLEFEGEYLNDKRYKGHIKIFSWLCELEFEGELSNGKINGKGKEYDKETLRYDGEYLNGKRNGKGKEYDFKGRLIFDGEYLNGKRIEK